MFTRVNSRMIVIPAVIEKLAVNELSAVSLSANNFLATSLTANSISVNNIFGRTPYIVTSFSLSSKTFANTDTSIAYHFETDITSPIYAIFPDNLENGFNISIFNNGTGTIIVSSAQNPVLNASGFINQTPYTGMFIYKNNNILYGVGVFV